MLFFFCFLLSFLGVNVGEKEGFSVQVFLFCYFPLQSKLLALFIRVIKSADDELERN